MPALSLTLEGSTVSPLRSMRSFQTMKLRRPEALLDGATSSQSESRKLCQAVLRGNVNIAYGCGGSTTGPPTAAAKQSTDFEQIKSPLTSCSTWLTSLMGRGSKTLAFSGVRFCKNTKQAPRLLSGTKRELIWS